MTNHYDECDFCGELSHRGEKCKPKALARRRGWFAAEAEHAKERRRTEAKELLDLLLELPLKERQKLLKK